ncbi:MAG TPA: NAD(P)H-binding protein [Vicinamibacterales bacterium]|nr:NAD(P)H-binding protein [Vicinamibacterales bacterium]
MLVIAGATGHVGSVAAGRLLAERKPVRVIVRDSARGARWAARGAHVAVADLRDAQSLAGPLRGATGFFVLLPPDYGAADLFAAQRRVAEAVTAAVRASEVPHVVLLSSVGADLPEGTGPIKGLHYFEECLRSTGVSLTALRASYFQENAAEALLLAQSAGIFPNFGDRDDVAFPMIATRDIGDEVAKCLSRPPQASEVVDLVGPDYTQRDVAKALGDALGKPLRVVNIPQPQWVPALLQAGLGQSAAEALAEMYDAAAEGLLVPRGDRLVRATTPLHETIRPITDPLDPEP